MSLRRKVTGGESLSTDCGHAGLASRKPSSTNGIESLRQALNSGVGLVTELAAGMNFHAVTALSLPVKTTLSWNCAVVPSMALSH